MSIKRIDCILSERSQYSVLHHFVRKTAEALQRMDFNVRVLTADDCVHTCLQDPPDMLFTFNGAPQVSEGLFICDVIDVPQISALVDPFFYYLGLLNSPNMHVWCDDQVNVETLQDKGFLRTKFFTQGVEPELTFHKDTLRDYQIVFFASFFNVEKCRKEMKEMLSPKMYRAIEESIQMTFEDESLSLEKSFTTILNANKSLVSEIGDFAGLYYMMSYLQKGIARIQLLESLKKFPIHIWDSRWKEYLADSNFIVHEAVDYPESLEIQKRSKIVLCNSIRSAYGCNERVLNALACGAVPVTNANPYFRSQFDDKIDLLYYTPQSLVTLPDTIQELLQNENNLHEIAAHGREKVMAHHTWDQRLKDAGQDLLF